MIADRTNRFYLLRSGVMPLDRQIALKWWLKHYFRNDWMRDQDGWLEAACLIASACVNPQFLDLERVLYCSHKGMFCGRPDHCRRCALDQRIEPAQEEYGQIFGKASYWYAMVAGSEVDPQKAGLRFGPRRNPQTWLPYAGRRRGSYITTWPEHARLFRQMATLPFQLCDFLVKAGIGGAFCHVEPHLSFFPGDNDDDWSGISHCVLAHGNILINSHEPIDLEAGQAIFKAYEALFLQARARLAYPDLWIDQIVDQTGIKTWLGYMLKSWPIERWYQNARLWNGCPVSNLNLLFDAVIFENLRYLTGKNHLSACLRSPRKYGNLEPKKKGYIAIKPPMRLTREEVSRWLKDERFAALHPEWDYSVYRLLEKWDRRKGRRTNLAEDDLDEAA